MSKNKSIPLPSIKVSLIPIIFLIGLLVLNVIYFGDNATGGANQLALLFASFVSMAIGVFYQKIDYHFLEKKVIKSIGFAIQASLILFVVGSLIASWILAGVVPAMIYYGLELINPSIFLPITAIVCALVSLSTGSSWSTAGTVGIALIGIGTTLGLSEGMVAGAIISGAYFGDKMSPLSDTTNLAPAMVGTDLFTHIKHMTYTSGPAMLIAVILFSILGAVYGGGSADASQIDSVLVAIKANFNITPFALIAPVLILFLVAKKVPAYPALAIGTLVGVILALIFQQDLLRSITQDKGQFAWYGEIIKIIYGGFHIESGNSVLDSLFNRGGMASMLSTVWLIIMAMVFGGVMEGTKMLESVACGILKMVSSTASLIGATLGSCLFINATAGDQYLAIVVPGRMFKKAYEDRGLHPKNLSRALEDSGTVTSALVPWNTGGAYNASVLGVATMTYLPFAFFNILSPMISMLLAYKGWTIEKLEPASSSARSGESDTTL